MVNDPASPNLAVGCGTPDVVALQPGQHSSVRIPPVREEAQRRANKSACLACDAILVLLLVSSGWPLSAHGQANRSTIRLFRLSGSFGSELPAKITTQIDFENPEFTLTAASLDADNIGFVTRLRSVLTVSNGDKRRITEIEWRIDIYDEALRSRSQSVLQSDKVNVYPGETARASAKFGAAIPDRAIVLLQLARVTFADGSLWSPAAECSLAEDLRTISCKSK